MHTIAPVDSAESLEHDGIAVLRESARFLDGRTLIVGDRTIRFRMACIATASRPRNPDMAGADSLAVLTTYTIWDLTEQPDRLIVVGGGPIGCELGQALARLGSHVTLIQRGERLIPKESQAADAIIAAASAADGVDVRKGRVVQRIGSTDGISGSLTLDDHTTLDFDRMLPAVGRIADTQLLALDNAGVSLDDRGTVIVDDNLRTTNPRIWAAGDVTALPRLAHTASVNGSIAASNAILGLRRRIDRRAIPQVTFTQPEVAAVGLQAANAIAAKHRIVTIKHGHLDRADTEATTSGFTQIDVVLLVDDVSRFQLFKGPPPASLNTFRQAEADFQPHIWHLDGAGVQQCTFAVNGPVRGPSRGPGCGCVDACHVCWARLRVPAEVRGSR